MMGQWNPLHDLVTLQDRMNRLFEDATLRRAADGEVDDPLEKPDWYPAADVYEDETEFTVAVDLPGVDRSTLDISFDDKRLTIKGTRSADSARQHRIEISYGSFLRTFSVPASVDHETIKADYKDGVLRVHLPKRAEQKTHRVEIKIS